MHQSTQEQVTDETLLGQYAEGNSRAFEILYTRHKKTLYSFIRRQCNNTQIAEELTHDAWLAIIKQADKFQTNTLEDSRFQHGVSFKAWLYRIAHNRLIDYWRQHGRSNQVLLNELRSSTMAEDRSSQNIEIAELLNQLKSLSEEQATTLLLKIEGFSHAEIANITDTKQETVKSRLRYATQRLRVEMELT